MSITSVAPVVDSTGISAPSYEDVLAYIQGVYTTIFGADIYIDPDSQDGQFQAVIAEAIYDCGTAAVSIYRSFSPSTATNDALSSNVKINGISRELSTYSTVDVVIGGTVGTTISGGTVADTNGNLWDLPDTVVIPSAGVITVTATAQQSGSISADPGTVTTISTPTRGWQTVTNVSSSAPGAAVESDSTLRQRQTVSTAMPSRTVFEGIIGAVAAITGVTRYRGYENDTSATDSNGLPGHSIALVVEGGDASAIATAIAIKKTPGAYTYGTTSEQVIDPYGLTRTIRFFRPTSVAISVALSIKALTGYNSTIGAAVQSAIADYINSVLIGGGDAQSVEYDNAVVAAKSVTNGATFKIVSMTLSRSSGAGTPDVPLAFNEMATCAASSVVISVS